MKETRFFYVSNAGTSDTLPDEEAQHAVRVLRLSVGDEVWLMDGCGTFYRAEITLASNHKCMYRIVEALPQQKTWRGHLCVAIAPTKNMDRIEWFVEKATEIGVDEIVFLNCRFSERKEIKLPRVEKICVSAVKQSRKPWMPILRGMVDFKTFINEKSDADIFIAHCYDEYEKANFFASIPAEGNVCVMIGPEGDFSIDEVQYALDNGATSVSLGQSRLRTETAGIVAAEMMQLAINDRPWSFNRKPAQP